MVRNQSTASVNENATPVNEMVAPVNEMVAPVNEMEIMEEIYLHKLPGEAPTKFVGLNGKGWNIPRGKKVKVPKPIAEILRNADLAMEEAEAFADAEKEKMNVIYGAP